MTLIKPALVRRCTLMLLALCAVARLEGALFVLDQIGDASIYQTDKTEAPAGSQIFPDFPASDSMALDDFSVIGSGMSITSVSGLFLAGGGFDAFDDVSGYRVSIFSSVTLAGGSLQGDIADLFVIPGSNVLITRIADSDLAEVTLFVDVTLPASGTYWLGIAPVASYAVSGAFVLQNEGAQGATTPGNDNGQFANPGEGHGLGTLSGTNLNFAYRATAVPEPSLIGMMLLPAAMCLSRRRRAPGSPAA